MLNDLRITVLSENNSKDSELLTEHGLSLLIETADKKYLFDTGASSNFLENAEKLNIEIKDSNAVFLSHGHYDHTGGLRYLSDIPVYIHPETFTPKYKENANQYAFIGIPESRDFYLNNGLDFIEINNPTQISPDFFILPVSNPGIAPNNFLIKKQSRFMADNFLDELALAIRTVKGLIVISGCSHNGIVNIIEQVEKYFDDHNIYTLLAGMHLSKLPDDQVIKIADQINKKNIDCIGVSHCSGTTITKHLNNAFNFQTGDVFDIKE